MEAYKTNGVLLSLRESFYSGDATTDSIRRAVARVALILSRGPIPHAVECTAQLHGVRLSANTGTHSLRLAYSMALVRFVNGFLDPLQQGLVATALTGLAKSIALPQAFVQLRHAATHESLPSLEYLLQMAERALDWLRVHYWEPLETTFRSNLKIESKEFTSTEPPPSLLGAYLENSDLKVASRVLAWADDGRRFNRFLVALIERMQHAYLVEILDPLFEKATQLQRMMVCLAVVDLSNGDENSRDQWVKIALERVRNAGFPIELPYVLLRDGEEFDSFVQLNFPARDSSSTIITKASRKTKTAIALPPLLEELLSEEPVHGKRPNESLRAVPSKRARLSEFAAWKPVPFGVCPKLRKHLQAAIR